MLKRCALAGVFWLIAAALAFQLNRWPVAAIASIIAAAWAYMKFGARDESVGHALGVGITWLVLAIAAEVGMAVRLGRGWYGLLGTPERPLMRNILLFVWIFAPALFARRSDW